MTVKPTSIDIEVDMLGNLTTEAGDPITTEAGVNILAEGWTSVFDDVIRTEPLRITYGIHGYKPTDRVADVGRLEFTLNNSEQNSGGKQGYYSPGHDNVRTDFEIGKDVRLSITYDGTTYYKYRGRILNVTPTPGTTKDRRVKVLCVDFIWEMQQHKMDLLETKTSRRSDLMVQDVVGNMEVSPTSTSYASGQETFAYAGDDLKDERSTALTAMQKICMSELGYLFVKGDTSTGGVLTFQSRRTRTVDTTSLYTFDNEQIDLDAIRKTDDILNDVRATAYPRDVGDSPEVLYSLQGTLELSAGETRTLIGRYRDPNNQDVRISGTDMITPVESTDYKFGSADDGTSEDLNADLTVTATYGANSVQYDLENTGAGTGYVNHLQARGDAIRIYEPAVAFSKDQDSKDTYNYRGETSLVLAYQDNLLSAQDFADIILARWKFATTRPASILIHANRSDTNMTAVLDLEPGERISLVEDMTGINTDYFINGVELNINAGDEILCAWNLAPASFDDYWQLGTAGLSEIGETTILGF